MNKESLGKYISMSKLTSDSHKEIVLHNFIEHEGKSFVAYNFPFFSKSMSTVTVESMFSYLIDNKFVHVKSMNIWF